MFVPPMSAARAYWVFEVVTVEIVAVGGVLVASELVALVVERLGRGSQSRQSRSSSDDSALRRSLLT